MTTQTNMIMLISVDSTMFYDEACLCVTVSKNENMADSDSSDDESLLETDLMTWVNQFQVKHNAVDNLLKILQQHGHPSLPATARTLLGTTKTVDTSMKSGMQYQYFPLKDALLKDFQSYPQHVRDSVDCLVISFNVDGVPLFKSSSTNMWPVLCGIMNLFPVKIFPVTLTCGTQKPSDLDFLSDVVKDLDIVLKDSVKDGSRTTKVRLRCVVCDAPAQAMVKATKL